MANVRAILFRAAALLLVPMASQQAHADEPRVDKAEAAQSDTASESGDSAKQETAATTGRAGDLPRPAERDKAVPEMLVKGHRSINTDVVRTEDDVQPYVVFSRDQIERSMASNLEEFLKTRLPMNTRQETNNQSVNQLGNMSRIDLRGLGPDQTLILVDGRRLPYTSFTGTFNQPDINAFPLAAIERIEVLPSTASGIYGGGAMGGAINIITRKDFTGAELRLTYGDVFEADAADRRLDAAGGFTLGDGQTHVFVAASHAESDPLLIADRDFVTRARELQLANNSAAFFNSTLPPLGATTNISSQLGGNLVLDNGTPLNSPRTFVPVGYAGPASDGGLAFVANAGQYNLGIPDDPNGGRRSLVNNPEVNSASLNVRRELGDRVEVFLDGAWLENNGRSVNSTYPFQLMLPANAPNNPFNTAINVTFPAPDLESPVHIDNSTVHATAGVIVRLPHDWIAASDYVWSRMRLRRTTVVPVADPDGSGPLPSLDSALRSGAVDVMRDVNAFPIDYSPYRVPESSYPVLGPEYSNVRDASLRLSGPLFDLPAGPLLLSAHAGHREQEAEPARSHSLNIFTGVIGYTYRPGRSQETDWYYLETRAPLVAPQHEVPFLRDVELQGSVRHDAYTTHSVTVSQFNLPAADSPIPPYDQVTNNVEAAEHTLGLRISPLKDLTLRASRGTGILPPNIAQIVPGFTFNTSVSVVDPRRGNVRRTYAIVSSQQYNDELQPEESESWSAGLIFTPRFARGLRLSVDYTHIRKTNEIGSITSQNLVNLEDSVPEGRVVRDPLTPADAALGFTGGVITALDTSFVNLGKTELEAWDVQLDYALELPGDSVMHFYTVGTYEPYFRNQLTPLARVIDTAGYSEGPLEWRGNGGLSWENGSWLLGLDAQYFDSYHVYPGGSSQATINSRALNQGSATIPSQVYCDLFARYTFDASSSVLGGALANTQLRLTVANVLDESPPIVVTTGTQGGFSAYGDGRMRRYSLSLIKNF